MPFYAMSYRYRYFIQLRVVVVELGECSSRLSYLRLHVIIVMWRASQLQCIARRQPSPG
jgi:hypothetical protein